MTPAPLPLPVWELSERWDSVPPPVAASAPAVLHRYVQFSLAGQEVCLPLEAILRVVPRLGRVTPLAGDPRLSGIALVGGQPLLVAELEESAQPLGSRPALVMPFAGGVIALVVSGPTDLIEASLQPTAPQRLEALTVEGKVASTASLLTVESVTRWLSTRLGLDG